MLCQVKDILSQYLYIYREQFKLEYLYHFIEIREIKTSGTVGGFWHIHLTEANAAMTSVY